MITRKRFLSWIVCCFAIMSAANAEPTIRFYSEIAAPFYWIDEQGEAHGANHDLANALIETLQLDASVENLPWARAFYETTHHPNVVLLSLLRTPHREKAVQWLGLVNVARASLIRLASRDDIQINSLDDARQLRVGTIRGYGSADYLQQRGFVEQQNLVLAANSEQLWSLLYMGRIDVVLSNAVTGKYEIRDIGLDPDLITPAFEVKELSLEIQMATGHQTSAETVQRLRDGLLELKASGVYDQIIDKWGLH